MDFDREMDLENAGIDAFEFSLMDDDERAEALADAGLDPSDFDLIDLDSSFSAWSDLQDAGLSLSEIELMDEDERRSTLEEAGLDPDDYEGIAFPYYSANLPAAGHTADLPKLNPDTYRYCQVKFEGTDRLYSYRAEGFQINVGDYVEVPTGDRGNTSFAKVYSVGDYVKDAVPYPLDKTKSILRKVDPSETLRKDIESELIAVLRNACSAKAQKNLGLETQEKSEAPLDAEKQRSETQSEGLRYKGTRAAKSGRGRAFFAVAAAAAVAAVVLIIALSKNVKPTISESRYTSNYTTVSATSTPRRTSTYNGANSYGSSAPSIPPRPPVNREKAMTKEEAERLSGTGYHGCRPNSSAENTELKAAQTKCKNCGYRTHNGANSLCDYCSWMERYGGGLPASAPPAPTPKGTPRPTTRPSSTPKPSDDPFHASDYSDPDDFYYDYYDDFWDFEDAEDYWNEHS